MDWTLTKQAIEYLHSQPPLTDYELMEWLKQSTLLGKDEKMIVFSYLKSEKPIIKDKELPSFMYGQVGIDRINILLNAWRSEQYHRYILHLFIAFIIHQESIHYAFTINDTTDEGMCGITGKKLYGYEKWHSFIEQDPENPEKDNKDYLAITNSVNQQTDQILSKEGLHDLNELYELLHEIDPDFMSKH